MTKSKLLVALIIGIAISLPVSAKMYKWVDDKGATHFGETIPPEYANKKRAELDKSEPTKVSKSNYNSGTVGDDPKVAGGSFKP